MLRKSTAIAVMICLATAGSAIAQRGGQGGGGQGGGGQASQGRGGQDGAGRAGGDMVPGGGLDLSQVVPSADQAFSGGVERSATVGRSLDTVASFSPLSQAGQAGAGMGARGRAGIGGMGGAGGMGGMGGMGGFNQFGGFGGGQGQQQQQGIRTRVRSAVTVDRPAPEARARAINTRVTRTVSERQMGDVRVEMDGRTAVLIGNVDSEDRRRTVERMLLLEPGVRDVRNELVVGGPEVVPPGQLELP